MKITSENLDNMGLVAGMCDEIGIVDIIDRACGNQATNKNLTFGEAVKCMILNGLGFVGRTLYLYSEYFEDKPVDLLVRPGLECKQIDDNVLGRTLDKLFTVGVSDLFTTVALRAVKKLEIEVKSLHLDATSFHVDGEYNSLLGQEESRIQLVQGYSRDHRPELNQVVLQMITSNQGNIPLFMQAASGNSCDKTAFAEIVGAHTKSFQEAVDNRYLVGDSALYTPKTLSHFAKLKTLFVTRVPSTISAVGEWIFATNPSEMIDLGDGYLAQEKRSGYGGVEQRWVLLFSKQAYKRETKTLEKRIRKESEKEIKSFDKLKKEIFSCRGDAQKQLEKWKKKLRYIELHESEIVPIEKYSSVGRPKKGAEKNSITYQVQGSVTISLKHKKHLEKSKGFFVLATNDLDTKKLKTEEVLSTYKSQQSVERGFRFLKSPDFLVSSFFLKKPERIEALLMVMTLCLLIYSAIEYKVRKKLKEFGEDFLDQKKRPSQNPTTRWVFFCFLGLHLVSINGKRREVTNLRKRHQTILRCLGPLYEKFYCPALW